MRGLSIFILAVCISCSGTNPDSIASIVKHRKVDSESELLFILLSPDECMSCVPSLNQTLNEILSGAYLPTQNVFIVMPYLRELEKAAYFSEKVTIENADGVIFNDVVYSDIERMLKEPYPTSKAVVFSSDCEYLRFRYFKSLTSSQKVRTLMYPNLPKAQ